MKSHEAMRRVVGGHVEEIAKVLRKGTSLIYKWTEAHSDFTDSGALNPLDRITMIISTALACGVSHKDATAPIQYLAHKFDQVVVDLPRALGSSKQITEELAKVMKEFSELTGETAEAIKDNRISPIEADRIEDEGEHLIAAAVSFIRKVRESVKE